MLDVVHDCVVFVCHYFLLHAASGSCRIGQVRFLTGWHKSRLNQALVSVDLVSFVGN